MTDDTDWLKKNPVGNPFKMSLKRSSRFYAQDMDASMVTNEGKKNHVLIVSHMPRRSNIPMEKIKQMDFKMPAPVTRRGELKKPVTRISRFPVPQASASRMSFRPEPSKNGLQAKNQGQLKQNARKSVLSRPSLANTYLLNVSSTKCKTANTPLVSGKQNQVGMKKNVADLSILSQSKVVNQSTPVEPIGIRSILKQNQNTEGNCAYNLSENKKSRAVKRVNFNGDAKESTPEKEKKDDPLKNEKPLPATLGNADINMNAFEEEKKDFLPENDEESTVAFSNSFKPIAYEDVNSEVIEENKVDRCDIDKADTEIKNSVVTGLMEIWEEFHHKVNDIRTQLHSVDESFQCALKFVSESDVEDKLHVYESKKVKLYKELKDLELNFLGNIKKNTDVNVLFVNYLEKKEVILKEQSLLEENFEKSLRELASTCLGEGSIKFDEVKNARSVNMEPSAEEKPVVAKIEENISVRKRKSGSSGYKLKCSTRKRTSKEMTSAESTPNNTPARRRKLSRKIEEQIRNLFEFE